MPADFEKEKDAEKSAEEKIIKQIEKVSRCPYCQNLVEYLWVHGHYQCPACKNVVVSCCGDD